LPLLSLKFCRFITVGVAPASLEVLPLLHPKYCPFLPDLFAFLTRNVAPLLQVLLKDMGSVVEMILTSLGDPHPRVRWAAINALGQLSTDLGPHLQKNFHARVLPALLNSMDDFQSPRVQVCESTEINCSHTASEPDMFGQNELCGSMLGGLLRLQECPKHQGAKPARYSWDVLVQLLFTGS
jgi:hypothetical protein